MPPIDPDLISGCQPGGILAGMSKVELTALLAKLRGAYFDLLSGTKGESFTYGQADGTKSVTYTRATASDLLPLIAQIQSALGFCGSRRAPIRPIYR